MESNPTRPARVLRRKPRRPDERNQISVVYNLFIAIVTILALVVMAAYYLLPVPEEVRQVLYILDSLNAFILLGDFFYRLYCAPNRLKYFASLGWLDLIGGIPGFPILRLARVLTLLHLAKKLDRETPEDVRRDASRRLASSTLLSTILIVLVVVTVGSIFIVLVEKDAPGGNILTGDDAVWWSIVTIATVGYGDRYPTTPEGRLIGVLMIVVGVSLFSVLTSFIATTFVARRRNADQDDEIARLRDEVVARFAEQQRSTASEAAALRAEISRLRQTLEDRPAGQDPTTPPSR
jgi:voltage-gated potassium channel